MSSKGISPFLPMSFFLTCIFFLCYFSSAAVGRRHLAGVNDTPALAGQSRPPDPFFNITSPTCPGRVGDRKEIGMDIERYLLSGEQPDVFRTATHLAMTESLEEEKEMIAFFNEHGYRCTATIISGGDLEALRKVTGNVIGACLNAGLIEKNKLHIHPLGHAIEQAILGTRLDSSVSQNCRFKVAIVRRDAFIAVVAYGDLGFHEFSSHKTIGGSFQVLGGT